MNANKQIRRKQRLSVLQQKAAGSSLNNAEATELTALTAKLGSTSLAGMRKNNRQRRRNGNPATNIDGEDPTSGFGRAGFRGAFPRYLRNGQMAREQVTPDGAYVPTGYSKLYPRGVRAVSTRSSDPQLLGMSVDGQAFAMNALDPARGLLARMPDMLQQSNNCFENKGEIHITWDPSMFDTAPTPAPQLYDVRMAFPAIPEILCIYQIRPAAGTTEEGGWSNTRVLRYTQNSTRLTVGTFPTLRDNGYSEFRITAQSETVELDAPDLANQGRVIVGQIRNQFDRIDITPNNLVVAQENATNTKRMVITLPSTAEDMLQIATIPYQAEAKEGSYCVHRFTAPLDGYLFHPTASSRSYGIQDTATPPILRTVPDESLGVDWSSIPDDIAAGSAFTSDSYIDYFPNSTSMADNIGYRNYTAPAVSGPCDMATSVHYYLGLATGITSAVGGVGSAASLRVKTRMTVEAYASYRSPVDVYAKRPPLWDEAALKAVTLYGQVMPDAYPACENDFSTVMGKVFAFLRKWVSPAVKVAGSLPVPGASLISDVVNAGIETGDVMLNSGANLA